MQGVCATFSHLVSAASAPKTQLSAGLCISGCPSVCATDCLSDFKFSVHSCWAWCEAGEGSVGSVLCSDYSSDKLCQAFHYFDGFVARPCAAVPRIEFHNKLLLKFILFSYFTIFTIFSCDIKWKVNTKSYSKVFQQCFLL